MIEVLLLVLLAALAWLWWDSLQAREVAVAAARAACLAEGLQFLDDTVGIAGIKPARNEDGRLQLQRRYEFEFTDTGTHRMKGDIVLLGSRVLQLDLQPGITAIDKTLH